MKEIQNKYHITDEGKIFSVIEDGSVTEIGNISSLLDKNKTHEKMKKPKSRKWMWIAIVSWVALIIVSIVFSGQYEKRNKIIRDLEQNLTETQSELDTKTAELDSINQQISLYQQIRYSSRKQKYRKYR